MEKTIYLPYINSLRQRLESQNGLIQVILGPRQVGKTTTLLKLIKDSYADQAHYVSADQIFNSDASWLRDQWHLAHEQKKFLFVDEIQKVYNWAEGIKKLYDEGKRAGQLCRCVLLGSSSLELQKGLSESLSGRFQLTQAFHWNLAESEEAYGIDFEEYLKFGGYPGSYPLIKGADWVSYVRDSIVASVVEKDILQYQSVKNPALFRQAFDILTAYPAQEISYTKLLGQLQDKGNVELVKHYIRLYEGAFLIRALEKFSEKVLKVKASSPKILPLAPCLYFLNVRGDYGSDERGRVFELIVGAQLCRTGEELFYWREGSYEVDYVLKVGKKIWAIEVKSGRKKNLRGVDAFIRKFPRAKSALISPDNYRDFERDPLEFLNRFSA